MPRRVLITGASGFLGRHVAQAWRDHGAEVYPLVRSASPVSPNEIVCDLAASSPDLSNISVDTVIHCAGKAHTIPGNRSDADEFFFLNFEGTKRLLGSMETMSEVPKRIVFISSAAVYGKTEGVGITESETLNGDSPYAASKIFAEEYIEKWAIANNVAYFILRLPLVVGAMPKGNLARMALNIKRGTYVRVRNNHCRKSMVLANDVAWLTLNLDRESGAYNLTDGIDPEFCDVEQAIAGAFKKRIILQLPKFLLKTACRVGDLLPLPVNSELYQKLTSDLTFSCELARQRIAWRPKPCLDFIESGGLMSSEL